MRTLAPNVLETIMSQNGLKNLFELARVSGVSHPVLYKFREGSNDLGIDTRRKIAHAFPLSAHLLVADIMPLATKP